MNEVTGTLICMLGGLSGAVFALPFRGIKTWRYESYWLVYALIGLVVLPVVMAALTCPSLVSIIRSASLGTLLRCLGFGALWGVGCVLFSSTMGVMLGEWRGTSAKTRRSLVAGLALLAVSIALVTVAKGI